MNGLSRYDHATLGLWRRGHADLAGQEPLAQAAVHAVLPALRRCADARALFTRYEQAGLDFALIRSLLPGPIETESLWRLRDAAFYLRWRELNAHDG